MRNPAFLSLSRHGIFYLRYPVGHDGVTSHVRLSLGTRLPKEALHLSRCATAYAAEYISRMRASALEHSEIREAVRRFLQRGIETARAQRKASGPLPPEKVAQYLKEADRYDEAVRTGLHWDPAKHAEELAAFISKQGLPIEPGTTDYEALRLDHMRGWRDLLRTVVQESNQLHTFDFSSPAPPLPARVSDKSLRALWDEFREYGKSEQRWTARTIAAKEAHIALLIEILGASTPVRGISRDDALRVRQTLTRYPANRYKMPSTRSETVLAKLLDLPDWRRCSGAL